jgi:hypothetical protein
MADNLGAIRLYQRCGFVHEGCKRDAVMRHRGFVDLLVMSRLRLVTPGPPSSNTRSDRISRYQAVQVRRRRIHPGKVRHPAEGLIGRDQGLDSMVERDGRQNRVEGAQGTIALEERQTQV